MKILFLGNNLSIVSLSCLAALLVHHGLKVLVGIHDPSAGIVSRLSLALQQYGFRTVLEKLIRMGIAAGTDFFCRFGIAGAGPRCLSTLARAHGVPLVPVRDINSPPPEILSFQPELITVANFSQLLGREILAMPEHGCINMHPSLLPQYRGPAPHNWVLKNREPVTGVTIHYLDTGIDTGDIILQRETPVAPGETERTLERKCADLGASLLCEAVELIRTGRVIRRQQDADEASYYSFPRLHGKP